MQTTNNPFAEVGVILIALGFIAAGTTLLALHTIDLNVAIILWTLAGSVAGINVALKAPSPTQQQLLAQALQTQQAQPAQVVQVPFNPAMSGTTIQPNFTTSYNPPTSAPAQIPFAPAIMTTQTSRPTAKPQ